MWPLFFVLAVSLFCAFPLLLFTRVSVTLNSERVTISVWLLLLTVKMK